MSSRKILGVLTGLALGAAGSLTVVVALTRRPGKLEAVGRSIPGVDDRYCRIGWLDSRRILMARFDDGRKRWIPIVIDRSTGREIDTGGLGSALDRATALGAADYRAEVGAFGYDPKNTMGWWILGRVSPDGKWLTWAPLDMRPAVAYVVAIDGSLARRLPLPPYCQFTLSDRPAWTADSKSIAVLCRDTRPLAMPANTVPGDTSWAYDSKLLAAKCSEPNPAPGLDLVTVPLSNPSHPAACVVPGALQILAHKSSECAGGAYFMSTDLRFPGSGPAHFPNDIPYDTNPSQHMEVEALRIRRGRSVSICRSVMPPCAGESSGVVAYAFSPDGKRMAWMAVSERGTSSIDRLLAQRLPQTFPLQTGLMLTLYVSRVDGSNMTAIGTKAISDPRFTGAGKLIWLPDGRSLSFDLNRKMYVVDLGRA